MTNVNFEATGGLLQPQNAQIKVSHSKLNQVFRSPQRRRSLLGQVAFYEEVEVEEAFPLNNFYSGDCVIKPEVNIH